MKAVVQRVKRARVMVEGQVKGSIGNGLLVYLGVSKSDTEKDADWLADKIINLRIFSDENDKMNLSIDQIITTETGLEKGILVISQFTLLGDCIKGRRPFFGEAADPEIAQNLYEYFINKIKQQNINCEAGVFQAKMEVESINAGPVTILLDTAVLSNT